MTRRWRIGLNTVKANNKFQQGIYDSENHRLDKTFREKPARRHDSTMSAPVDDDDDGDEDEDNMNEVESNFGTHASSTHPQYPVYGTNGDYPSAGFAGNGTAQPQTEYSPTEPYGHNTQSQYTQPPLDQSQGVYHGYHHENSYGPTQNSSLDGSSAPWTHASNLEAQPRPHELQSQGHGDTYGADETWGVGATQDPGQMQRASTTQWAGHYPQYNPPPPAPVVRRGETYAAGQRYQGPYGGGNFDDIIHSAGARAQREAQNWPQPHAGQNEHGHWNGS